MSNGFFRGRGDLWYTRGMDYREALTKRLRAVPVVPMVEPLTVRLPRYYAPRRGCGDIDVEALLE